MRNLTRGTIMRHYTKLLGSLATTLLLFTACSDDTNSNEVTHKALSTSIIHINDNHSHLTSETMDLEFNGVKTRTTMGGFSRVASKIKALQDSETNPITVSAGDFIQGTLYYSVYKGDADTLLMNEVAWDAITLGNHEFDDGDEGLKKLIDNLDADIISANVEAKKGSTLDGYWKPYKIIEREGEKIGLIGLEISQKTKVSSRPSDDIIFYDEVETTQKYVDELRSKGINKIILVSHFGMKNDLDLATKVDGVDIIIDGDSHSLLGDFSSVGLKSHYDEYPKKVSSKSGERVCVASAWQYNYTVGDLEVDFSKDGLVEKCEGKSTLLLGESFLQKDAEGNRVDVNESVKAQIMAVINENDNLEIVEEDAATLIKLETYSQDIEEKKSEVVGSSKEYLGHNRIPGDKKDGVSELALGSDIAPLVAKSFYEKSLRADACIQNAGGVRIAIDEGDITIGEAYTLLPFSNTLFELDMSGAEIKQVLEDAMNNYINEGGSTGSFPYAYGLRYDVDTQATSNNRISNLEILNRETQTFSPIENSTMYVIVTNDYIASGRDGYTTFKTIQEQRGEGVNTYYDYADSFVDLVRNLSTEKKELAKLPTDEHPLKSYK